MHGAFGSYDQQQVALGLKVRHDHRSRFMSDDYQKELDFLCIESSPATSESWKATSDLHTESSDSANGRAFRPTCLDDRIGSTL